jgi:polyisoprenoid-binding protein YceI
MFGYLKQYKTLNMKKSIFLIGLVITLVSCNTKPAAENAGAGEAQSAAVATGTEFALNTATSTLGWKGQKPGGEHFGVVSITEGKLTAEGGKLVSGAFTIDLNSITDTDLTDAGMNGKLVGHLKSPDFFDVAQFPTAKFELVSVAELPAGTSAVEGVAVSHQITGNLTMKGVSKSISFPAQVVVSESAITAVTAPFAINRTEWGVNYGSKSIFAELKDKFINDEMIITLNLSFSKI